MRISLCMIVKNEEENIINCLERALKVVDEAIVVDTGSTDKTKELLEEKYGNDARVKILEEKWENDFSKARNKSLEYATGDWILILDADERIFCDRGQLEAFLRNSNQPAYNIPIYNIYGKDNFTVSTSMIRLYKNNNPKYRGAIHEQLEIDGRGYLGEIIDKDICKIYHYGYSPSVFQKKNKSKRNMDIINEEIKRNPKEPFNWYNKGVMEMIGGNFNKALDDFIKAHKLCNNIRRSFHNDLLIRMIQCLMMLNSYKQAARFIEDISKDVVMKDMPDIYYYLGVCYTKLKKYDAAIKNFQKAVNIGEYYNGISKFGVGSFLSMIEWAKVLELKGEKQLAIEKYKEAVFNENNVGKQGLDDLKRLLKEEDMIDKLNQLEKMLSNNNTASSNATSTENSTIKNYEYERYKKEVKESIQTLIENGMLTEAKEGIAEYENIVKNDADIYSIKGVIAMMEEDFDEAERAFKEGLDIQPDNCDLLYNLAYLYETQQKYITAYRYYKKIIKIADAEMAKEIIEKVEYLEKIESVKEYCKRRKVLFIAYIFPPVGGSGVQRSLKFVKYLRDFGWEPVVIATGKTRYLLMDETMLSEVPEELEVVRIDDECKIDANCPNDLIKLYSGVVNDDELMREYIEKLKKPGANLNQLIFCPDSYILWAMEVLKRIDKEVDLEEIDIIYSTSAPYSDHIIGYYLKQKYNKPWVADFRDEWTNNPMAYYPRGNIRYKIEFAMESNIVKFADKVITVTPLTSENYMRIFNLKNSKVETITNGYDEEDFKNMVINANNNKFTIMHNGILYGNRSPVPFINAVNNLIKKKLIEKDKIIAYFSYIENDEEYIQYVNSLGLNENIKFIGYLSHIESLNVAGSADLLLLIVGREEKWKSVFTGKVFEYLRLCKPILALSPKGSVVEELLKETNRGENFDFSDVDGIEKYILKMYENWERNSFEAFELTDSITRFERKVLTKKLSDIFEELGSREKCKEDMDKKCNNI